MKLLILTYNLTRPSFRQRIELHLDILRNAGIDCEVCLYPRGNFARWKTLKRCSNFDAVLLQKKTLNLFDGFLLRRYARKVIFDFDDAIMYSADEPEKECSPRKYARPFERTVKLSDLVIAGNSYLAQLAESFSSNVEVIPTGLDISRYELDSKSQKDDKIRLVWIGSRSTLKYLRQIAPALEQIGQRFDNVVLRIICDSFFDLQNMAIEKCHWSLETQAADLVGSDIGLSPLEDDRFTRGKCGFKILQYAASGLPVVASPAGVNSDYVKPGTTGLLAISTSEWVDSITRLIKESGLRKSMGENNLSFVRDFDADIIGRKLAELIKNLCSLP
jgi:glycosyltransferase involved in cell wall biosynthesis